MTNYDPRLELARRLANSRRTNTPLNLGTKISVPTTGITDPKTRSLYNQVANEKLSITQKNPNLAEQVRAVGSSKPTGSFGKLLHAGLGAIAVIDTPRRAVISGVREVVDVLDSDPNTKGSLSDWAKQTKNPMYGFGTAFPMKGNWGRFVGFIGDVALDPLTYATAGAKGTVTFSERFALYNTLRAKGISSEVAGQFLQRGKTALTRAGVTSEQLAEMGLKRSGVYMFGSKLRVPLTGPIGESMLAMTSKARIGFTGTRFGETLQRGFMGMGKNQEQWIRGFRMALARNEPIPTNLLNGAAAIGGIETRDVAVKFLNANLARETAQNIAKKEFGVRVGMKLNEIGPENLEPYRNTVYQVIEGTRPAANAAEEKLAKDLTSIYEDIWTTIDAKFKQVDPEASVGFVKEYFPWVITDEARKISTDLLDSPWVKDLQTILDPNPLDVQGSFKSRTLKEGTKWFWTTDNGVRTDYILKADDLNITRLNEISRNAIGVDFWKTDAAEVLGTHYLDSASKHMGLLAMYDDMNQSGVIRKVLREAGQHAEMTEAHAAAMGALVESRTKAMQDVIDAIDTATKELNGRLPAEVKRLESVVSRAEQELSDATAARVFGATVDPKLAKAMPNAPTVIDATTVAAAKKELANAKRALTNLRTQYDTIFERDIPHLAVATNEMLDRQISNIDDLEIAIAEYQQQLQVLERSISTTKGQITKTEKALAGAETAGYWAEQEANRQLRRINFLADEVSSELELAVRRHEEFTELSNIISNNITNIVEGKRVPSGLAKKLRTIVSGGGRGASSLESFAISPGALNAWMDGSLQKMPFFQEIQEAIGTAGLLNVNGVKRMKVDEVFRIAAKGGVDPESQLDAINAAVYFISRDMKFYGSVDPVTGVYTEARANMLSGLREDLIDVVKRQSEVLGFLERARMGDPAANKIMKAQREIASIEKQIVDLQDTENQLYAVKSFIDETLDGIGTRYDLNERFDDFINNLPDDIANEEEFVNIWLNLPEDATLRQVLDESQKVYESHFRTTTVYDSLLKKETTTLGLEELPKLNARQAQIIGETPELYDSKVFGAGGKKFRYTKTDVINFGKDVETLSKELTDKLAAYALTSEVERRFKALGMELAPLYHVPTDGMYGGIMRKVASEHLEAISLREASVSRAYEKMTEVRQAYEEALGLSRGNRLSTVKPIEVLDNALIEAYESEPEIMNEVFGSIIRYHSDSSRLVGRFDSLREIRTEKFSKPLKEFVAKNKVLMNLISEEDLADDSFYAAARIRKYLIKELLSDDFDPTVLGDISPAYLEELRTAAFNFDLLDKETAKGVADFRKTYLKPWFEEVQPYTKYDDKAARKAASVHVPFRNEYSIKRFFIDELGGIRRNPASTEEKILGSFPIGAQKSPMVSKSPAGEMIISRVNGRTESELSIIRSRRRHMVNILDPQTTKEQFFANPFGLETGPFSYLESLKSLSDTLDHQIKRVAGLDSVKGIIAGEKQSLKAGGTIRSAEEILAETNPLGYDEFGTFPQRGAFDLTPQEEQNIAKSIQGMRAYHERLTSTPEYAIAMQDQEITNVLRELAVVDGHTMTDLRTGEAGWVVAPKSGKIKLADYGMDDTSASMYYRIQDASGDYTPDSYLVSPDGLRVINVDQSSAAVSNKRAMIQRELKPFFPDNADDPRVQYLLDEYNNLNTKNWRHVKLTKLAASDEVDVAEVFKLTTNQTPTMLLEGQTLASTVLSSGITGEQTAINIADIFTDIKTATENKFATFIDPNSTKVRRQTADWLLASDVIDEKMHQMIISNKPISTVLETMIKLPDNSSITLSDVIKNWEYSQLGKNATVPIEQFESEAVSKLIGLEGRLSFSEDEWGALFTTPFSGREALNATNRIRTLNVELEKFRGFAQADRKIVEYKGKRLGVQKRIKDIEAEIADLELQIKTRSKATQGAALVKFQQLFDQFDSARINAENELAKWRVWADQGLETVQVPDGKGGFRNVKVSVELERLEKRSTNARSLNDTVSNFVASRGGTTADGNAVQYRRTGLQRSWQSTESYGLIKRVEDIGKSDAMKAYRQKRSTISDLQAAKKAVDDKIKISRGNLSYTEKDLIESAQRIINTVNEFDVSDVKTAESLVDSLRNAFVIGADGVVQAVKYEGLSREVPKATRNLIAEIQATFPEKLPTFTVDAQRVKELEDAIGVAQVNAFDSHFVVAKETLRVKDALSPYNQQIVDLRKRLITLTETQALQLPEQEALLKIIADLIGLSEETRATIQREWIDGYGITSKGNISNAKNAKQIPSKFATAEERVVAAQSLYNYLSSEFNSILPRFQIADDVATAVELELKPKIVELKRLIKNKQDLGTKIRPEATTSKFKGVTTVKDANLAEFETWLKEAADAINAAALKPDDAVNVALAEVARAQTVYARVLIDEKDAIFFNNRSIVNAFDQNVMDEISKRANEAYVTLEKVGLKGMEAPQEVLNMFAELRRFKEPAFSKGFAKFLDGYTRFFKRYATLSPGFHIRNAMSNSFALVAAGGDLRNFPTGLRLYREMQTALDKGTTLDNWIRSIIDPTERVYADLAARSMFAAGGGQTEEAIGKFLSKRLLEDNYFIGKSRSIGGKIENSARFILGYDSAVKGFDLNVAAARTKRFLIDYEDVGQFDKAIKTIVPFWMWTSRALPMHLTNMIVNPKPYQMYRSFERNFKVQDKLDLTPDWVDLAGGFKITQGTYLMPDLGFNRIPETVAQLSSPAKLLANVNPALRVPLELAANKQFYNNREFSDKPKDISDAGAANFLLPLLEALGKGGVNAEGKQVADEKALYALSSLLPTFGQVERLLPSSPSGKSNLLGYLGVPLRGDSESMKRAALFEELNKLTKLKNSQGM